MIFFLSVYVLSYLALNLYALRWLKPGFGWKRKGVLLYALFTLVQIILPIIARRLEYTDDPGLTRFVTLIAYAWMPFLLWFVCFGLLADLWNLLVRLAAAIRPRASALLLPARRVVLTILAIGALLTAWGLVEVRTLRLKTLDVVTDRLPPNAAPLRLVQISDVHFNPLTRPADLDRLLSVIRNARPDILVCTGDLFDSPSPCMDAFTGPFAGLECPLGKFAVLGNHEYFTGLNRSLGLLRDSGFRVLRQEAVSVRRENSVVAAIAGVDDFEGRWIGLECLHDESQALSPDPGRPFTLLLKHHPIVLPEAAARFDLQLSGHTHAGQVFPFEWAERFLFRHTRGYHPEVKLYISPGTGTWGPPLRVFAPPTVTLFVIRPAPKAP